MSIRFGSNSTVPLDFHPSSMVQHDDKDIG